MVFSSVTFLFYFLPIFLILYFISPFKNTVLLVTSLFFYAWGEAGYIILLLVSITINYIFGLIIDKFSIDKRKQKISLLFGVTANLILLGYYKYFNFITENIFAEPLNEQVHLPLGISFFTFQAISYLVDVYRKEAQVEKNPFNLALFISMFPQLVAGPIVRFKTVAEQIHKRSINISSINMGIRIFVIGLSQKALIANSAAVPADNIFALSEASLTIGLAWLGAVAYSIQIYFDFAGYSNMAIGLGLILGFSFPKNFNYPYISQSITEFWRRWHISLSTWFRDYLYIPLGGNRLSPFRTYLNLMLVFLLCGLWHGAAWTFIIWGAYHGLFLMIERMKLSEILKKTWRPFRHIYTLIVVIVGWVLFRSDSLDQALYFLKTMFTISEFVNTVSIQSLINNSQWSTMLIGIVLSTPIFIKIQSKIKSNSFSKSSIAITGILEVFYLSILLLSLITISSGSYNPFIYFRF